MQHPRLIIFTGKGGVGKTTLALAYAKYLTTKNFEVKYNSFNLNPDYELISKLGLNAFDISIDESAEIYIGNKLNSKTIAAWIMSTHFFKSLFQMIPGLGNMILLGHILKELEQNPNLIIVLDSPASGHALSMFESSSNFKRIFKTGLIVDDIEKMKLQLEDPNFLKTYIVSLPNEMAMTEASELETELKALYSNTEIIVNNSFKQFCLDQNITEKDLPLFLAQKIINEEQITNQIIKIPYISNNDFSAVSIELSKYMEKLS